MVLLVATSQLALTGTAFAQSADPSQDSRPQAVEDAAVSTIVVTARRREEALQDVPISISALSGDALTAKGVTDSLDLQNAVPSLSVSTQAPNRVTLGYAIRGQRTNESQLLTDPPVGIYFNEVVMPRSYGFGGQFYDLQSVQVLKGVQGTLFGRNMTGGAVLIESAHPDLYDVGAEVRAQYGNYNLVDVQGMVNVPVVEGVFALRAAGKYRDRDGFTTDVSSGRKYDDEHYYSFRVSAALDLGNFRNNTVFDYIKHSTNGAGIKLVAFSATDPQNGSPTVIAQQAGLAAYYPYFFPSMAANPVAAGAPLEDVFGLAASALTLGKREVDYGNFGTGTLYADRVSRDPFQHAKNWGITNKTELDVGSVTFRNIVGYREQEFEIVNDYDGFAATLIQPDQFSKPRQFSEEFQMQGTPFGDALNLTLGAYYFHEWGKDGSINANFPQLTSMGYAAADENTSAPPSNNPFATFFLTSPAQFFEQSQVADTNAYSWAVYAAGTYRISDQFSVAGGIRYNRDVRKVTVTPFLTTFFAPTCVFNGVGTLSMADCAQSRELKNEAVTWDATLQYEPNPDFTTYVAVRQGYRAGGFSLRATTDAQLTPFQPEKVREYELGLKNKFFFGSARLDTNVALFYQDYSDVQKQVQQFLNGQVQTIITNTTAQENYGGEFEANLMFSNGLAFDLFYAYTGLNIKSGGNGGYLYQGISKHQVGGGVSYVHDYDFGKLSMNVNGNYRSGLYLAVFDPASYQPGYALFNARLAVDNIGGSGFGVAAFVRNITDKYYQVGNIGLQSAGPVLNGVNPGGGVGYAAAVYGDPRTYGIEASFKF
ncbi:hypothetical protein LK12_22510 [Novosphingobium malaysiense]|uniref:TonB-dependent receptor n=2 Tax=Novosphingobium malaysiense TaxID=1348853 RepID=A0A0B1ZIJ6_9SPHN|nr:hypothetical protein LK12_22510 [Novosphingobium malaysiense]